MLMISRRLGERIVIGDDIEIIVAEIHRRTVRLGVRGGTGKLVLRGEVRDAIEEANRRAAESAVDVDALGDPAVEGKSTEPKQARGAAPRRRLPETAVCTQADEGTTA